MADNEESTASELQESIEENVEEIFSDYSLEFDQEESGRNNNSSIGRDDVTNLRRPSSAEAASTKAPDLDQHKRPSLGGVDQRDNGTTAGSLAPFNDGHQRFDVAKDSPPANSGQRTRATDNRNTPELGNRIGQGNAAARAAQVPKGVDGGAEPKTKDPLPVQVLRLKARLNSMLESVDGGPVTSPSATVIVESVTREHQALHEELGAVEQELIAARQNAKQSAATRLRQVQEKRVRAEARRVRHFEQLGEAKRLATVAKAVAQAERARSAVLQTELRHIKELLEAARSSGSAAEELVKLFKIQAESGKLESERLSKESSKLRLELEEERVQASVVARGAADNLQLCERKLELEVASANAAAEARERAAEMQLTHLPEHRQQLIQAETERVSRWEERLAAETACVQRREEMQKRDIEAFRAQMIRTEADIRARAEDELGRERAQLQTAQAEIERERGELLQRVAKAEAVGQARETKAVSMKAEATEAKRRVEAERSALETRVSTLAPHFTAVEEGRTSLEEARRQVREESRRVAEEARRARELERSVRDREATVESKWDEITSARRVTKQLERNLSSEAKVLSEQGRAVELARVRLLEQQMEVSLQVFEIRKALDIMRRVDKQGDRGCRRLALELGTLALARPQQSRYGILHSGGGNPSSNAGHEEKEAAMSEVLERVAAPKRAADEAHSLARSAESTSTVVPVVAISREPQHDSYGRIRHLDVEGVRSDGRGVYADEQGTRKALEKVREVIALGALGASRYSTIEGNEAPTTPELTSVQAWATKLQAAAIATGALPPF